MSLVGVEGKLFGKVTFQAALRLGISFFVLQRLGSTLLIALYRLDSTIIFIVSKIG